jgi:predicted nucleic-acid-binding protein
LAVTASLDTNVLVRLLVHDDAAQTLVARALVSRHVSLSEALLVPITVALELEWVLRSRYKFSKAEVLAAFATALAAVELEFESESALEQALAHFDEGHADLADYVHLALAQKRQALPFWTFDVGASKADGARLLK